jgi:aspartyl-tRNA(Asn)/glutamyl-tRNA(Gln) amidotransferase subunit C
MPSLSRAEVEHVARLARLELDDDEVALYTQQLGRVLDHFAGIASIDTADVPPTVSPPHLTEAQETSLRPDMALPSLDRGEVLRQAPDSADGYFRVPELSDESS